MVDSYKFIKYFLFLFLFAFTALPNNGFGQQALSSENIYVTVYGLEEGLHQSMVSQVYQDTSGLLWMVTGDGLHCFDGKEFKVFRASHQDINNHSDNLMRHIGANKSGFLAVSSNASLLLFDMVNGRFDFVYRKERSYPTILMDQFEGQKSLVWLNDQKLCFIDNGRLIPRKLNFSEKNEPPTDFLPFKAMQFHADELLIFGKDGFIVVNHRNGISDSLYQATWMPLIDCQSVAKDKAGRIFVFTQGVICEYQGIGKLKSYMDTHISEKMNLFIDSNDNFWLTGKHKNKLLKISNTILHEIDLIVHNGKHSDTIAPAIISMFEDDHHNIWMGTGSDGVLQYAPQQLQFDRSLIGFTRCIAGLGNEIWAGTYNNGLWRLSTDLSKVVRIYPERFKNDVYILDLHADHSERLWVATRNSIEVLHNSGLPIFSYPLICQDAKFIVTAGDTISLVCDNRLIRFNGGKNPSFIDSKEFALTSSFLGTKDAYWVGGPLGLFRSKKVMGLNKAIFNDPPNHISSNQVNCLLEHQGCIWVATGNGIEIYNQYGARLPLPVCMNDLRDEVIYSLMSDDQERIWFTSNHGISFINEKKDNIVYFNALNNIQSLEFNNNAALRMPNGTLYFGGIHGLNGFDPSRFQLDKVEPTVRLISFTVSDTSYSKGIPPDFVEITLHRKAPNISGQVFCSDFANSGEQLFSFYLEGYQQAWSKPSDDAEFQYRDLPSGHFKLWAKCADTWHHWSKPTLLLSITLKRPFWKTWWFMALMTAFIAAATTLIYKRIHTAQFNQRIKALEQEHAIEKERLRIARDMHDEVGASLTRISILSELAKKQTDKQDNEQKIIAQISEIAGNVVDEMSEIIWAMNPKNDSLDSFAAYIRRYASTYLETSDILIKFNFPAEVQPIPMSAELCRNLFLTIKEALHNIVKHANAKNINLTLQVEKNLLEISIQDDGIGFLPESISGNGNGLVNMHKRVEDCFGTFQLDSEIGKGTEIRLIVSIIKK